MILAVRLRGGISVKQGINDTMSQMRLSCVNRAALFEDNPANKGMLQKSKDYITWGEISEDALAAILPRALSEEALKAKKFKTYKDCAKAILGGKLEDMGFKSIRLHPPRGGLRTIKRPFKMGGDLGYRGEAICDLVTRMR